ncbi:GNAT family N-acetyltransferase [Methyloraptor flagellatus]|uniref:GNAT family N-acetyltransferase n=1 Tax=Methyloraptor flagellatus TaxID=3162530 RepID=A0AAU7XB34_9HYPH
MTTTTVTGSVRKLWIADLDAFRQHLTRLDPATRRQRFGMGASDEFVSRYAETSFKLDTLIHGWFSAGMIRGVGELRAIDGGRREAEAAFSVEAGWQNQGVGSELMERTLLAARNRGISRVYMSCLASNGHMQRLARRFGAELEYEAGDVVGLLLPPSPSPVSYMKEAVNDASGWATAVLDLQRGMLHAAE